MDSTNLKKFQEATDRMSYEDRSDFRNFFLGALINTVTRKQFERAMESAYKCMEWKGKAR